MIITTTKGPQQDFERLMSKCLNSFHHSSNSDTEYADYLLTKSGSKFERVVFDKIRFLSKGTVFQDNVELISGQRFPDIIARVNEHSGYGVEVKTSIQNHWRTTGNSVFESTRVENIERIYMFFGKLAKPVGFKCRKYEDCLYDVAITHSPRYLIDMELSLEDTIFNKVGRPYDDLRTLDNPFGPIKDYYKREVLKENDEVWWVDKDDSFINDIAIKPWNNVDKEERERLICEAMILFPKIFGCASDKFDKLATWFVFEHSTVHPNIRDSFTAGGRKNISVNRKDYNVPKVVWNLRERVKDIFYHIDIIDGNTLEYHWGQSIERDSFDQWIGIVELYIKETLTKSGLSLNIRTMIEEILSQ